MVLGVRWGGVVLVLVRRSRTRSGRVVEEECVTLMSLFFKDLESVEWKGRET